MDHKHGPTYKFSCSKCRIAFIHSARPSRKQQNANILYLTTYHGIHESQILKELFDASKNTA